MTLDKYNLEHLENYESFTFVSSGPKGDFTMIILFNPISNDRNIYNMGFGVYELENNSITDTLEIGNGDDEKILATVAEAAIKFSDYHCGKEIIFAGNKPAKTRKYRLMLARYFERISIIFTIYGLIDNEKELYFPNNTVNYEVFLAIRKS